MRPQEFVYQLANKINVPEAEVSVVDRYLANAGLRQKASGRAYPELTSKEAIRLVLALMGARTPARAVTDLLDIERFTLMAGGITFHKGGKDDLAKAIGIPAEYLENGMPLIEVLDRAASHVAAPWRSALPAMVWTEVQLGGFVTIKVEADDLACEMIFTGAMDTIETSHEFTRSATLGPKVFAWVGHVTQPEGVTA